MEYHNPNHIDTDFKAVTIAAELIEQGKVSADQLVILPVGPQQQAYAKEIKEVTSYQSAYRNRTITGIYINREGLYDMLPEGLFHEPPASSVLLNEEGMIKDIAQRREEEKQARQFFAPMEAELYHLRTIVEMYENRLDKKSEYDDLINIFLKEWKEFSCFTKEQMVVLLQVLPMVHEQRNNLPFIAEVFKMLFNANINVRYKYTDMEMPAELVERLETRIGQNSLGVNFIAGRAKEQEEALYIEIGPLSATQMLRFLPGTRTATAVDALLSYFIPLQTTIQIQYTLGPAYQRMALGQEEPNGCLGYTTFLGA
jgi:type VI secretion system protein ImpH